MEQTAMIFIIYLFSLFTLLVGMAIVIKPVAVYDFIDSSSKSLTIHILAVLIRGLIGLALLSCSPLANFPVTFQVLGWASLASALMMLLIGRTRFKNLIGWAVKVSTLYKRLGGLLAVLFGSLLFYGVV